MTRLRMNDKQWQRMTPGQNHESTAFDVVLKNADENLFDVNGEPVPWPIALAGDKGYRADWTDTCLMALEISPVIPSKSNEDREARPVPFNGEAIGGDKETVIHLDETTRTWDSAFRLASGIRNFFGGVISTPWVASVHRQPGGTSSNENL